MKVHYSSVFVFIDIICSAIILNTFIKLFFSQVSHQTEIKSDTTTKYASNKLVLNK